MELIKQQYESRLHDLCKGKLGMQYLRQHERTVKKFEALAEQQKGYDILVVAAQFGLRHRGRSVRRAREVFTVNEFGLGVFEIGCMLLTHPGRLQDYDDLWIDCAGDEYDDAGAGSSGFYSLFRCTPYFGFSVGKIVFGAGVASQGSGYGSASGFLPQ